MSSPEFDAAQAALDCVQRCVELPDLCQVFVAGDSFPAHENSTMLYVGVVEVYPTTHSDFPLRNSNPSARAKCFATQAVTLQLVFVDCYPVTQNGSALSNTRMNEITERFHCIGAEMRGAVAECFAGGSNFESQTYDIDANTLVTRLRFNLLLPAHCFVCAEVDVVDD